MSDPIFSRVPAPAAWARPEPTTVPAAPVEQPDQPADSEQE